MSYEQRIYEDFDDYPSLVSLYDDIYEFADDIDYYVSDNLYWLSLEDYRLRMRIEQFIWELCIPIYYEYKNDKIGYNAKTTFLERVANSLCYRVNKWYLQGKIDKDILNEVSLERFINNGETESHIGEKAKSGSIVNQESASTPTGITHDNSDETSLEINEEGNQIDMETSSGYPNKYTNFMGKTSGIKKNDVDRDTQVKRTSNLGLAMDNLKKIPYSYISEVLQEVSKHFIQIY